MSQETKQKILKNKNQKKLNYILEYSWYIQQCSWKKLIFPFPKGINCKQPLDGSSCSLPRLSAEPQSGLDLCRPCECCHSLCEFWWASVLLYPEGTVSLEPSITSGFYSLFSSPLCRRLYPEGRGLEKTFLLGLSAPGLSLSAHCSVVDLCVSYRLLQEEPSLKTAE